MFIYCTAYGCNQKFYKGCGVKAHSFPLKDNNLLTKWLIAMRREDFKPTIHSRICGKHFKSSDYYSYSRELLKSAIPSVFNFPAHLQKPKKERRLIKRTFSESTCSSTSSSTNIENKKKRTIEFPKSPTEDDLKEQLIEQELKLKSKIKVLKQKVRRKERKLKNMSEMVEALKEKKLLSNDASSKIENAFSGLDSSITHQTNMGRVPTGRRYPDEVKRFALTVHFYSPKAYNYLRTVFSLPHSSSLYNWSSTVDCNVGFFKDVFAELKNRIDEDPLNTDCGLVCDAMSIKSSTFYNKAAGSFKCDYENEFGSEDLHSSQLIKMVVNEYLNIRLYSHGIFYEQMVIKKGKVGTRQQSKN